MEAGAWPLKGAAAEVVEGDGSKFDGEVAAGCVTGYVGGRVVAEDLGPTTAWGVVEGGDNSSDNPDCNLVAACERLSGAVGERNRGTGIDAKDRPAAAWVDLDEVAGVAGGATASHAGTDSDRVGNPVVGDRDVGLTVGAERRWFPVVP